jgi:putative ABC transport system ATP-binding protein
MGATGSGKSTLLHCAAGLERPSEGTVRLVGADVGRMRERRLTRLRRDHVGFVFQSYNLLSELTVARNVLLPRRLGAPAARTLADVLDAVGLGGMERRPGRGTFADEPTGALDPETGAQILRLMREAADTRRVTVVMVTHDPLAASMSDRLVLLRAGRIVEDLPTPGTATIARRLHEVAAGRRERVGR